LFGGHSGLKGSRQRDQVISRRLCQPKLELELAFLLEFGLAQVGRSSAVNAPPPPPPLPDWRPSPSAETNHWPSPPLATIVSPPLVLADKRKLN